MLINTNNFQFPFQIYLAKINKRVRDYKITMLNEPRAGKKLLVLDIDYTLFDHRSVAETGNYDEHLRLEMGPDCYKMLGNYQYDEHSILEVGSDCSTRCWYTSRATNVCVMIGKLNTGIHVGGVAALETAYARVLF